MLVDIGSRVGGWVGRVAVRRLSRKGADLSRISFIPGPTKVPLKRIGTDPIPRIAELRRQAPLCRLPMPFDFRVWLVTGYEEARAVLTARDTYSTDIRHLLSGDGPATSDDIGGLGFTDPPVHTRLRRIITPEFTMRRLPRLEPFIDEIVDRQLDEMEEIGSPVDLAKHLALPVPFQTICQLLGLDYDDREAFARLGSARFDASAGAAEVVAELDRVWGAAFRDTQARTHVLSGTLKASGLNTTEHDADEWEGTIQYGGPGVEQAIYEMARGGEHDFFAGMPTFDEAIEEAMLKHFDH